jgi:hypothetical protein
MVWRAAAAALENLDGLLLELYRSTDILDDPVFLFGSDFFLIVRRTPLFDRFLEHGCASQLMLNVRSR